jgi:hypothetical protein
VSTLFRVLVAIVSVLAALAGGFTLLVAALLLLLPGLCRIESSSSYGNLLESSGLVALLIGVVLVGISWPLIKWSTRQTDSKPNAGPNS